MVWSTIILIINIIQFTRIENNKIIVDYKKITDIINLVMFVNGKSDEEELYSYYKFIAILQDNTNSELAQRGVNLNIDFDKDGDFLAITFN